MSENHLCVICNRFVDKAKHKCPQAKKLIKDAKELKAPYVHSDALPSIWRS